MNNDVGAPLALVYSIAVLFVYFLPTLVAYSWRRRQVKAIFMLDLLLGWTVLGWAVALVWAFIEDRET